MLESIPRYWHHDINAKIEQLETWFSILINSQLCTAEKNPDGFLIWLFANRLRHCFLQFSSNCSLEHEEKMQIILLTFYNSILWFYNSINILQSTAFCCTIYSKALLYQSNGIHSFNSFRSFQNFNLSFVPLLVIIICWLGIKAGHNQPPGAGALHG